MLACIFSETNKLLVSFFSVSHKLYTNFSNNDVSIASFHPVLRSENILIVSQFLYKPFDLLFPPEEVIQLFTLLSTAVCL